MEAEHEGQTSYLRRLPNRRFLFWSPSVSKMNVWNELFWSFCFWSVFGTISHFSFKPKPSISIYRKGNHQIENMIPEDSNFSESDPEWLPSLEDAFSQTRAEEIIRDFLKTKLTDFVYHRDKATTMTFDISHSIQSSLSQTWPHFKSIVQTWISESMDGIHIASRALWDSSTDGVCHVVWRTNTCLCIVAIFVISGY